jgi:uncharacterized protein (TIGR03083 family)
MTSARVSGAEYVRAYLAVRARIAAIVPAQCEASVPACPGWRVHEVVAHLAGLCEDWVDGRLDGYATEAWTADQVSRHAHRTCDEILDRWADAATRFAALDEQSSEVPPARFAFGDAVVHEADVRGVTAADRVPDDAVLLGLHGTMARWGREVLAPAELATLRIRTTEGPEWWLGTENDSEALVVEAPMYEVFRALAGRRSKDQARRWEWSGDPAPVIEAGLPFPFRWAPTALVD